MVRGLKLAALGVVTICLTSAAAPDAAAVSLVDRLKQLAGGDDVAAKAPPVRDAQVRPAAAVAARDAAMGGSTRRSSGGGGSLFGALRLPGFNQQGGQSNEEISNPPLPYDPAELNAQGAGPAMRPSTAGAAQRRQSGAAATRPAAVARTATGNGAGTQAAARRAAPVSTMPKLRAGATTATQARPGVVRTSPRAEDRHNELAEAMTGLRGRAEVESAAADDADMTLPAADAVEEVPRYLSGSPIAPAGALAKQPARAADGDGGPTRYASGPVDVAEALNIGGDAEEPVARRPRGATAVPPAPRQSAAPRPGNAVRRSPTRTPIVETDVASALRGDESRYTEVPAPQISAEPMESTDATDAAETTELDESDLGGIAAEPAPMFDPPSPTGAAADNAATQDSTPAQSTPAATTSRVITSAPPVTTVTQPTKIRPTTPIPPHAGNLRPRRDLLLSGKQPVIVSSVAGPTRIAVGRTAEYRVSLENKGDESARELVATIAVPAWAEVIDAVGSNGAVDRTAAAGETETNKVTWQLYELAPGASQTLTLHLIPRSGRPLQLGVQWDHAPVASEATVEVEEPKLHMEITGPAEVLFGKSQRYTLTLSNPGTGAADDVKIELTPPGGDPASPVRHSVGTLAAGATKSIELELTAREAGDLKMFAVALAPGDLRIEATKTVLCRKADLKVEGRGPDKNFAGAESTYYLRVRNPGTAQADQVSVSLNLPMGAELVEASDGHAWDAGRRMVTWKPGSLAPNEERFMQVRCRLTQPGVNQMELIAQTAAGDLSDVQSVPVTIEALADLKLVVTDPQGVIPVGEEAMYEIKVQNRGLTAARGVNVVVMFSEGIDPMNVEGGQHEIRDGRMAFRTIDALPAGAETVLRIRARATAAGTHVFRAEVVCDDLETKLAAEETTRFFVEEERWADASSAYSEGGEEKTR